MKAEVAVIIPNYNNGKYIYTCINSILNQTYHVKEIVVYDDCSNDESVEILKQIEGREENVRVIFGQKRVGVSMARDIAIKATSCEYVTMLDSDDYYYSNDKIENEMEVINHQIDDSILCCVFSQTVKVNEMGHCIGNIKHKNLSKNVRFNTITRLFGFYTPRDYIFPKSIYQEIGGYRYDMNLYEDWELNLRLMSRCEFVFSGGLGTAYRQKEGGLSKVSGKAHLDAKKKAFECNRKALNYSIKEEVCFYCLAYINYFRKIIKGLK